MNLSPHPSWAGAGLAKEVQSLGCHGASLNWARASSSSSKFIPSLRVGFGWGTKGPWAGPRLLAWPSAAGCGFSGDSGMQAWVGHCPSMNASQGFGVSVCLLWVFLGLRRRERADTMTPLHPSSFTSPASRSLHNCFFTMLFPLSLVSVLPATAAPMGPS